MIDFLTENDIVHINERTARAHGGKFEPPTNYLHEEALVYLVEAAGSEVFGAPMYPSPSDKAAHYMFSIISNHVFQDGNKRTGLQAARTFVQLNGGAFHKKLKAVEVDGRRVPSEGKGTKDIWFYLTMEMAAGAVSLEETREWFKRNTSW